MKNSPKKSSLWAELLVCRGGTTFPQMLSILPWPQVWKTTNQISKKGVLTFSFPQNSVLQIRPQPLYRKPNTSNWLEKKMILCSLLFCCHLDICSGKHKTWYPFHLSFLTQIMFLTKGTYYRISTPRTKVPDPSRTYTPTIITWWSAMYPCICQATWYSHTLKLTKRFSL